MKQNTNNMSALYIAEANAAAARSRAEAAANADRQRAEWNAATDSQRQIMAKPPQTSVLINTLGGAWDFVWRIGTMTGIMLLLRAALMEYSRNHGFLP